MHDDQTRMFEQQSLISLADLSRTDPDAAFDEVVSHVEYASASEQLKMVGLFYCIPEDNRLRKAIRSIKIAYLGNSTSYYVARSVALNMAKTTHVEKYDCVFDAWEQDLLVEGSDLEQFSPDVIIFHLGSLGLTEAGTSLVPIDVERVYRAIISFFRRCMPSIIFVSPEPLEECNGTNSSWDKWYSDAKIGISNLVESLLDHGVPAHQLDPVPLFLKSRDQWNGIQYWSQAKLPFHPEACMLLGRHIAQFVESLSGPPIKAIAVDCDNTLWGDMVGEVGPEGVNLSVTGSGIGYLKLQKLLKTVADEGVILLALSKNTEENVMAVFDQRSEMILKREDFTHFAVNWEAKAHNLMSIVDGLNIGLDSVLFLDDSKFE